MKLKNFCLTARVLVWTHTTFRRAYVKDYQPQQPMLPGLSIYADHQTGCLRCLSLENWYILSIAICRIFSFIVLLFAYSSTREHLYFRAATLPGARGPAQSTSVVTSRISNPQTVAWGYT